MRKLGVTQRKLLWTIARRPGWTLTANGVGRDRTTVANVLTSLQRRALVEPLGEGWQVSPAGAACLLQLWPAYTSPSFGAALRNYLSERAENASAPAECAPAEAESPGGGPDMPRGAIAEVPCLDEVWT